MDVGARAYTRRHTQRPRRLPGQEANMLRMPSDVGHGCDAIKHHNPKQPLPRSPAEPQGLRE
eukprot:6263174-Alexandrium_andersonii.AAC.1